MGINTESFLEQLRDVIHSSGLLKMLGLSFNIKKIVIAFNSSWLPGICPALG